MLRFFASTLFISAAFSSGEAATLVEGGGQLTAQALPRSVSDHMRFTDLDPQETGIHFLNRYDDPSMWGRRYREFTLGSVGTGVAIGDFDNDGLPDIYAVSKTGTNALFRQTGSLAFTDIAVSAGVAGNPDCWSTGVTTVDINNDGLLDIYLCNTAAANQLFVNQGNNQFTEEAAAYGLDIVDASVMAAFSDYDRDGDLDLYLATNLLDYDQSFLGRPDHLFRNNGNGPFSDVTTAAGISGVSQAHSATWWDYDHNGWPDLYVANDFEAADHLYHNNGDGTFTDVISKTLPLTPYFSMGSDLGDINNDGLTDFFVGDMAATTHEKDMVGIAEIGRATYTNERAGSQLPMYMRNAFYLNTGSSRFAEIAYLNQLDASDWTWATRFADLNNDGLNDLFITNGNVRNFMEADLLEKQSVAASLPARIRIYKNAPLNKERNLAFLNKGDLQFENVSKTWGLDFFGISFGAAMADLDRDGDLDIVVNNHEENLKLYRNEAIRPGILLRLVGTQSNRFGIGAEARLKTAKEVQVRQLTLARGALSSDEPLLHFGGWESSQQPSLEVKWPSGAIQKLTDIEPGSFYTLTEPATHVSPARNALSQETNPLFAESAVSLGLDYVHSETNYNDFESQYLLPRRLSQQGPPLAWIKSKARGDLLIIGGSAGHPTSAFAFRQNHFEPLVLPESIANLPSETLGIADLGNHVYFANGGVEGNYADLLSTHALESVSNSRNELPLTTTSAVASGDFDGDGDLDLFVGGRSSPGAYPQSPYSYLLENRDGVLIDVTEDKAPGLHDIGMVTSAIWSDGDGDLFPDLLLTLDWGPVSLFSNNQGELSNRTEESGLARFTGWWNSIAPADFNRDGLIDYAVGNVGLNTKYHASDAFPTELFYGDLDGSGQKQILEAQHSDNNENLYPIRPYSKLRYAFPNLQAKFDSFRNFAQSTVSEIFGEENLSQALHLKANTLESGAFINNGNATFSFHPLPRFAQLAPTDGIVAQDFDGDGNTDLFLAQNAFSPEPATGRFNGAISLILLGDGNAAFTPLMPDRSGIVISGDAQSALSTDLNSDGWADLIVAQNRDRLLVLKNQGHVENNSFSVELIYRSGNPHGFGSRVKVSYEDRSATTAELVSNSGYLSLSEPKLFFGYKERKHPTHIEVTWPDGTLAVQPFEPGKIAYHFTY